MPYEKTDVTVGTSQAQIMELLKGIGVSTVRFSLFEGGASVEFLKDEQGYALRAKRKSLKYNYTVAQEVEEKRLRSIR